MQNQLEIRLKELKSEFETGQKMLADLEERERNLRESLLRISGAIQVLEEELEKFDSENGKPDKKSAAKKSEITRTT